MTDNLHKKRKTKESWTGIHVITETVRVSPPEIKSEQLVEKKAE